MGTNNGNNGNNGNNLQTARKESWIVRFAKWMERVGNKIPHPLYLFLILTLILIIASFICAKLGITVEYIAANRSGSGELVSKTVTAYNMLSVEGLVGIVAGLWDNYAALNNTTLMLMLGMGLALADHTGMFSALIRRSLLNLPSWAICYVLCVVGICSNICVDAGMFLAASLGAIIYRSIGRNPWIGGITGYTAAAAGFTSNIVPTALEATLAPIAQNVIDEMGLSCGNVTILSNYIFTTISTFILAGVITLISELLLPRLFGDYSRSERKIDQAALKEAAVTSEERRGLHYAAVVAIILTVLVLLGTVPANGFLRNAEGSLVPNSPFMNAIVPIAFLYLALCGAAYGVGSSKIKKANDVPPIMYAGVTDMAPICLTFFMVSIFLYVFNTSNLSYIIAVGGEKLLRSVGLTGLPLMLVFILIVMIINLFMYSASTKWLIFAPVFIPMFANLGVDPAWTMLAYRIGDSCTNSLTPLNACLIATIAILNQYRDPKLNPEEAGVGTVISGAFPICMAMQITFILMYVVFWVCGIPIGIG